jgi:hypothetical protein
VFGASLGPLRRGLDDRERGGDRGWRVDASQGLLHGGDGLGQGGISLLSHGLLLLLHDLGDCKRLRGGEGGRLNMGLGLGKMLDSLLLLLRRIRHGLGLRLLIHGLLLVRIRGLGLDLRIQGLRI